MTGASEAMKVSDSGMPEEAYWETLFDVPVILDRLKIDGQLGDVVEFGCGYGTFTVPVAKLVSNTVTTFDIDEAMIERTRQRSAAAGAYNVRYVVRDVFGKYPMIAALKQAIALNVNDPVWAKVRPPLVELTTEQAKTLVAELKAISLWER